jgi:tight adherence protein B
MDPIVLISIAAFVGVAALVGGIAVFMRGSGDPDVAQRLDVLTGHAQPKGGAAKGNEGVLFAPLDDRPNPFEVYVLRLFNLKLLLEQADAPVTLSKFAIICGALGIGGAFATLLAQGPFWAAPIVGIISSAFPLFWLVFRRKRRMKAFAAQMPDALDLIARALRSGHSLASGFNLVAQEMSNPIASEFNRVFEEQNLGIALEDALDSMTERIPNLDLKFFSTAVILQRTTGGDLAEILDKIGYLIRERFKIWGQVQALTGEGRLSGVVLLGLPPLLMLAVWRLNPEYISVLFSDELGKQMLAVAAVMQVLGALVIRKIVNIKV